MTTTLDRPTTGSGPSAPAPTQRQGKGTSEQVAMALFVGLPFLAVLAAIPVAWGWGLTWRDVIIAAVMYMITGHAISIGFHRYFVHGSFKATRPMRALLAVLGQAAIEGDVITWVADHRRHHKFSDKDGDPHSPWRFGNTIPALARGFVYAHIGWLFRSDRSPPQRYAPDLLKDPMIVKISKNFLPIAIASLLLPAVIGGLWSMSWQGAATAFFWGSLARVGLLHHVTWSINSICHTMGDRPFESRDKSGNVWWLAVLSFGESWHNLHHADPTSARHGVLPGQIDTSARLISWFEKLGWVRDVRWPTPERIAARRLAG
ncbi:MAG: fatty acid desaturase [Actinomycetes bacterium]|jgi:stearoyl-CoA desaturase (delta-9 desaturase)